jgi:hypothetical protein
MRTEWAGSRRGARERIVARMVAAGWPEYQAVMYLNGILGGHPNPGPRSERATERVLRLNSLSKGPENTGFVPDQSQ